MEVLQQLEPLMREIIAPQAAQIDEQARYPRAALDALAAAGLLGLISASEVGRSEEHTSELQSQSNLVCRLLLEKKKNDPMALPASCPTTYTHSATDYSITPSY